MHVCLCQQLFGKETAPECATSMAFHGCLDNDHARQLSNWCDICKVAKVVHRNWSDNNCNRSDTLPSINTTTRALLLYWQIPCSLPHLEHTHTPCTLCVFLCAAFFSLSFLLLLIDDLQKSRGLHLVRAFGHGPVYLRLCLRV